MVGKKIVLQLISLSVYYIIIFLLLFEIFSYISTQFNLLIFNDTPVYNSTQLRDDNDWRIKDPIIGSWHKPFTKDHHVTRCFDVEYRSNNIGARDDKNYNFETFNNSIILIGDSYAEGIGVNLDKTFSKIIEKKLKKNVINLGVAGSNVKDHYKRFSKFVKNDNFSEIIYFFLPANDYIVEKKINHDNEFKLKNKKKFISLILTLRSKIKEYLAYYTYSYNALRSIDFLILNKDKTMNNYSYKYNDETSIDNTFDFIEKIIQIKNKKKTLILIPIRKDFQHNGEDKSYKNLYWYKQLTVLAEKNNTKVIDLYDFIDLNIQYKYFHNCDLHWSNFGNESVANFFLQSL
mgnify:FL=1|jgi:hypothetical protein|tara:strand:+ start:573 stop:1613 length:1041 start_codon:yes stop_codon:yes gene_type:complete